MFRYDSLFLLAILIIKALKTSLGVYNRILRAVDISMILLHISWIFCKNYLGLSLGHMAIVLIVHICIKLKILSVRVFFLRMDYLVVLHGALLGIKVQKKIV